MPCEASKDAQLKIVHTFLAALGLGVVVVFILSLPELKRYIKISTM
jgi:hypothetical protein